MTQSDYDLIVKIICNGAPALAVDLCDSFTNLVKENTRLKKEIAKLTKPEQEAK